MLTEDTVSTAKTNTFHGSILTHLLWRQLVTFLVAILTHR